MDGSPYGWPGGYRAVRVHLDGSPVGGTGLLPPMAVLTRPQDWAPPARAILWPELERRQVRG